MAKGSNLAVMLKSERKDFHSENDLSQLGLFGLQKRRSWQQPGSKQTKKMVLHVTGGGPVQLLATKT